jgi:hypothetical protein
MGTLFQFGVLRPTFGDARLADQPAASSSLDSAGFGERASQPFYQTRFAVSRPMQNSTATVGVGAHYGREIVGATTNIDSWAFTLDFRVPVIPHVVLRGEGYMGSNLVPFGGGILQGVAAVSTTVGNAAGPAPFSNIRKIGDGGGWAELTFLATPRNVFYLGASEDDPKNKNLLPGSTRQKNSFVWASYFRKITNEVSLAGEWSNWEFRTIAFVGNTPAGKGPYGRGNVFNIALAYQF